MSTTEPQPTFDRVLTILDMEDSSGSFLSQDDLDAAEAFVRRKLDVDSYADPILRQIMNLVAADMVYPRVTGEARGQEVASASQGGRTVEYTASSADAATGNSTHWQKAMRLSSGELAEDNQDFWFASG